MFDLTPSQQDAVDAGKTSFLLGAVGTGKSTALQQRLLQLLARGETAYAILVLVAEPEHRQAYLDAVHGSGLGPYADLNVISYNQMAMEMTTLFWPLVAREAGFAYPSQPPTVLSYDLAQLLMWQIVRPMLEAGAFANLRARPQQIVSQLLDTLNRAALNGLTVHEAIERQILSWAGEPERIVHLQEAANAARSFRQSCLDNSLLDLSLAVATFDRQLARHPEFQRYFSERYRHLIVDNVEEYTPAGQHFIHDLLTAVETTTAVSTAAIAYDAGGGYKRFMGADPRGANKFRNRCNRVFQFDHSFTAPPEASHLANLVENHLLHTAKPTQDAGEMIVGAADGRYRREMIANLIPLLQDIIEQDNISTSEIAIIAPYLDGALRYTLTQALKQAGLPYRLLRRRSSPREEPRVRAWLTWLALAHPDWAVRPSPYDVAEAFALSIHDLDPARAGLLTEQLYRQDVPELRPVEELSERVAERVGLQFVGLVEELRIWLLNAAGDGAIDFFLYELFSQLLSQKRFQPKPDVAGAAVCDWLVKAAVRLRQSAGAIGFRTPADVGRAFIDGINQGLVTANPPELGDPPDPDGIMISTIYGYLLAGKPVKLQVWLETAATGWWDIPNQPLSNAFVLAPHWDSQRSWTMDEDFHIRNELLSRIARGLTGRCKDGIILASSDLDRRGQRQDSPLWRALQPVRLT